MKAAHALLIHGTIVCTLLYFVITSLLSPQLLSAYIQFVCMLVITSLLLIEVVVIVVALYFNLCVVVVASHST